MTLTSFGLWSEEVITTKKDQPDGYFGVKLGAIVTPTFGYRVRDKASGVSDTSQSDRTGFSMPWTLFMVSKEWEDTGFKVEFWGEVLKANQISADTNADNQSRSNPHIFAIRRANVQKIWTIGSFQHTIIFGMQELPHMHSVWAGFYDWRYMDRSPLESLGFSPDPVDLGLSYLFKWKTISLHTAFVNGEGYRSLQNANNSGYDSVTRLSWENTWLGSLKTGLHFLSRRGNFAGYSGTECFEGRTRCLPSDNNPATQLRGNVRLSQSETHAVEINMIWREYINLGIGGMFRKRYAGEVYDQVNPYLTLSRTPEFTGRGAYAWLGIGNSWLRIVFRGEIANGGPNAGLRTTESNLQEPWVRLVTINQIKEPVYSDKSYYRNHQVYLEYIQSESIRMGIGYSETRAFDQNGAPLKTYVDQFSNERSLQEYRSQFTNPSPALVSEYGRLDRNLFLKANLIF
ncbi:hypothetical protein LPTSP4_30180 [Leptospira ryugenii]|uniref:Uncharacterized protein n=1 Tax=Leptospira ryugenii TaxID=1917863 RepID=A0A2P2E3K8_9LEPT|nr:hypothetical protein [Leptospira ryugenii]GBF51480.1 hypothetical protein LPTSP4_30180 [Leptospira ryugenii]